MNIHHKRAGRARRIRSPEEIDAEIRIALIWREIWRAEKMAPPQPRAAEAQQAAPRPDEAERKKAFAKGIARLEFGRAYWDEKRQGGGKGGASERKPKPRDSCRLRRS